MSRRALTLLLTVAAALGAGAAGAVAWFSTGSNATISVTAFSPVDIRNVIFVRSQASVGSLGSGYALQYVNGKDESPTAATGTDGTLAVQLGRHQPGKTETGWPDRLRVFTVHVGVLPPSLSSALRIKVESLDGTIASASTSRTTDAGSKLTSRIRSVGTVGTPPTAASTASSVTPVSSGERFDINLRPITLATDDNTLWNATVRVTVEPVTPGASTTYTRDIQVLWCNKPGATANCA